MPLNAFKALMDAGFALEKLRIEFLFRMVELTFANIQSMKERVLRLNALCGKQAYPPYPTQPGAQGVAQLADIQAKYLSNCGDSYVKEARNLVQAAFLTQNELMYWTDRMVVGWSELTPELEQPSESDSPSFTDQRPAPRRPEAMRMRKALSFMKPSASF